MEVFDSWGWRSGLVGERVGVKTLRGSGSGLGVLSVLFLDQGVWGGTPTATRSCGLWGGVLW